MGDPYLNSGESFIITTHRISVGFSRYDMILTTRHLILIDSSSARFEPNKIPLTTILSVAAGRVATGEPVITLAFTEDTGTKDQQPQNLLFAQRPGEHRKRERDLWIRKLMEQIVLARQQEICGGAQPPAGEPTPRPPGSPSHTIEFAVPHKSVVGSEPAPVELDVFPEEPDQSVDEMPAQTTPPPDVPEEGEFAEQPRTEPPVSAEAPQELPENEEHATTQEHGEPAEETKIPPAPALSVAMGKPVPAGEVQEEEADFVPQRKAGPFERLLSSLWPREAEPGTVPEASQPSDALPVAEMAERSEPLALGMPVEQSETGTLTEEILETTREEPPAREEPLIEEEAACPPQTSSEFPAGEREEPPATDTISPGTREQDIPATVESGQVQPAEMSTEEEILTEPPEPSEPDLPKEQRPPLLSRLWPVIAMLAIIVIFLILLAFTGGILFSMPSRPGSDISPLLPPVTPSVTSTAVITHPQTTVPQTGVWVLVTCNGSYTGWIGNPGNLMHIGGIGTLAVKIIDSNGLVQASLEKQDFSGSVLTAEVYRNGIVIHKQSTNVPRGSFDFIIDAKTGEFPGGIPTPTSVTGLVPGETYRY